MKQRIALLFLLLIMGSAVYAQTRSISGQIIDKRTREPLPFLNVVLFGTTIGTMSDDNGIYTLSGVKSGVYRVQVSGVGYKTYVSPEFQLAAKDERLDIEIEESPFMLNDVTVTPNPFRSNAESPLGVRSIGFTEIEKSAGSNRDISRVVQSFPGVASSPAGYRNDLIVRGGGPSENRFYVDGIEIPNINHFATQGASGGPISIISSDLVRDINFYTAAFPSNKGNAMSSVMDFKLKEVSPEGGYNFSGVVGSSEVGLNTDGHIGKKTTYLVSVRQSYLQFLFQALKLPFLPTFNDMQAKVKHKLNNHSDLSFLAVVAIDNMKLNTDTTGQSESNKYTLSTLPVIKQFTYTVGGVYRHYQGNNTQTIVLSRNYMKNTNFKHLNNDETKPRTLDYESHEIENKFRFENLSDWGDWKLNVGAGVEYVVYDNNTRQLIYTSGGQQLLNYKTDLSMWKWNLFGSLNYESPDERLSASASIRTDANSFNSKMGNPLRQLSPRLAVSYGVTDKVYLNANVGRYYQLAPYTSLGFKNSAGEYLNKEIDYLRSDQLTAGVEYRLGARTRITVEGFYKWYAQGLMSVADSIPIASKGNDYGVYGAEALTSTGKGRAYGLEVMGRIASLSKLDLIASYTFVRSEYQLPNNGTWIPSSWDNRHLFTLTGGYDLPRNWRVGAKFRVIGGAPYTPWDVDRSSMVEAWDATGKPYYDYSRFNTERLGLFTQLDLRVDKTYYWNKVMFGFYIDLQNALNNKYREQNAIMSTGRIINPDAPRDQQQYEMKEIERTAGRLLPSVGLMVRF